MHDTICTQGRSVGAPPAFLFTASYSEIAAMPNPQDTPEIISRQEAKAKGLKHYYAGKPCKHGHASARFVSSCYCIMCLKERHQSAEHKIYKQSHFQKNKERILKECKIRYGLDKARILNRTKQYYEANKQAMAEASGRWRKKNWENVLMRSRGYCSKRRALLRALEGSFSAGQITELYGKQKGKCACCRKPLGGKFDIDHIIALKNGGLNNIRNIQIMCATCNRSKSSKDAIEFMQSRGFLI